MAGYNRSLILTESSKAKVFFKQAQPFNKNKQNKNKQ